jgi:phage major head subunit gpT-like protein
MPGLQVTSAGIIGTYYERFEAMMAATWANLIGSYFPSDSETETYPWLGATPAMREWAEGRLARQLRGNNLTITNKTFESTIAIDVDDYRRNKTPQIEARINGLADRTVGHWESLLSTLVVNGNGTGSGLAYDGQSFFDDDHSEGSSGTVINDIAAAQVAQLNVGTATAPTEAEMALAILNTISYMMGFLDDAGEPIHGDATNWLVMCPINLWGPALSAAKSRLLAAGGAMSDNPLSNTDFDIKVIANPRLASAASAVFFIFRTDGNVKPFILQEELAPEFQMVGEGSEHAFSENEYLYGVKALRNVGYGLWQHAARATLS